MRRVMPAPAGVVPVLACFVGSWSRRMHAVRPPRRSTQSIRPCRVATLLPPPMRPRPRPTLLFPPYLPKAAVAAHQPEPLQAVSGR